MTRLTPLTIAIAHYKKLSIEEIEKNLSVWLDEAWSKSPYKDILVPYLILRKLEINEQEI